MGLYKFQRAHSSWISILITLVPFIFHYSHYWPINKCLDFWPTYAYVKCGVANRDDTVRTEYSTNLVSFWDVIKRIKPLESATDFAQYCVLKTDLHQKLRSQTWSIWLKERYPPVTYIHLPTWSLWNPPKEYNLQSEKPIEALRIHPSGFWGISSPLVRVEKVLRDLFFLSCLSWPLSSCTSHCATYMYISRIKEVHSEHGAASNPQYRLWRKSKECNRLRIQRWFQQYH